MSYLEIIYGDRSFEYLIDKNLAIPVKKGIRQSRWYDVIQTDLVTLRLDITKLWT